MGALMTHEQTGTHTPTPWRVTDTHPSRAVLNILDEDGEEVACCYSHIDAFEANAAFIVECVNSHAALLAQRDALVAALENAAHRVRWLMQFVDDEEPIRAELADWDALVKSARGEV
jgi:hypothetical protein